MTFEEVLRQARQSGHVCASCLGTGKVEERCYGPWGLGHWHINQYQVTCKACEGTGLLIRRAT